MDAPQKIAVVAFSAPPHSAGGVASAHYNLAKALKRKGFDARLFTFGDRSAELGEFIIRRGSPAWLVNLLRKSNSLFFGILQPGKRSYQTFDILSSLVGAWRMNRAIQAFAPHAIFLSDHGAPGLMLRKRAGQKVIWVSHHNPGRFLAPPAPEDYSRPDARLALMLEQIALRKADVVICPSRYMKDFFERSYRFEGPVHVIPNLLDEATLSDAAPEDIRPLLGLPADAALVYLPSAGTLLKGAAHAPAIIRKLQAQSDAPLGFYLPGEIAPDFQGEFARLAEEVKIYQPGQLPYARHVSIVKGCSFGISPSLMENYSMALLEAIYLGVPMLAFDTGGNADIIQPGVSGQLVEFGDAEALSRHALALLDKKELHTLRQSTRTLGRGKSSPAAALASYIQLLESP